MTKDLCIIKETVLTALSNNSWRDIADAIDCQPLTTMELTELILSAYKAGQQSNGHSVSIDKTALNYGSKE